MTAVTDTPTQPANRIVFLVHPADGFDRGALRTMLYEDIVCWLQDVGKLGSWSFAQGPNPGLSMELNNEYDLQYAWYHTNMALKSMIRHGLVEGYEWVGTR